LISESHYIRTKDMISLKVNRPFPLFTCCYGLNTTTAMLWSNNVMMGAENF